MKLLIVTQIVDTADPVLGFFHQWIEELAKRNERVTVICLKKGEYSFSENVTVYSLGKENGTRSRVSYAFSFISLAWNLREEYEAAFVHMNQEYILITGWLWKVLGKHIYLWRNHYSGTWITDIAAAFCAKVFCTSRYSYTAKYKNTVFMPVGVDTVRFSEPTISQKRNSILFFARMSPSKKAEVLIDALKILKEKRIKFTASLYGSPLPVDEGYYSLLKKKVTKLNLENEVTFYAGVPNTQAAEVFGAHEIFVNCSRSGMFDKTLFEAAACGCHVLAASEDWKALAGEEAYFTDTYDLAGSLEVYLKSTSSTSDRSPIMLAAVEKNSLSFLAERLREEIV